MVLDSIMVLVKLESPEKMGQIFSLHLAADERLTEAMIQSKIIAFAYETVQEEDGSLPLLIPMSEVAGRMALTMAA